MFESLGAYAEAAKWATALAILTLLVGVLTSVYNHIEGSGYNRAVLEIAAQAAEQDEDDKETLAALNTVAQPEVKTVKEIVEVIKYVNVEVEKTIYVCNNLGPEFIRVRNNTRNKIFHGTDGS